MNTENLLSLLGIYHPTPMAQIVAALFIITCWLLVFLIGYVLYERFRRLWSRRNNLEREEDYRRVIKLFLEYKNPFKGRRYLTNLKHQIKGKEERGFFRRVLLSQMGIVDALNQDKLRHAYKELGYLEEDLKGLRAWAWWARLASVLRLEVLQQDNLANDLVKKIDDRNELVAIAAMRALSPLNFPNKTATILDALSRRAPARKDVFIEILINIGKEHVFEIVKYLNECFDPFIASICVRVLGELGVPETLEALFQLSRSSSDEVVSEATRALSHFNDPRVVDRLRELLEHSAPLVRVHAISGLMALGDQGAKIKLEALGSDPSMDVRRAAFEALSA